MGADGKQDAYRIYFFHGALRPLGTVGLIRDGGRMGQGKRTQAHLPVHTTLSSDFILFFFFGLNKILFTHRNHKLNKQVQETQKQYAYLSVTYIQNDNLFLSWCFTSTEIIRLISGR